MEDTVVKLLEIIKNIRNNAEDIVTISDFGLLPLLEDAEDYNVIYDKLISISDELFKSKERLNKDFSALKRKI